MIKNERQYKITRAMAKKFETALDGIGPQDNPMREIESNAIASQLHDLKRQIEEYETLVKGHAYVFGASNFAELPRALIRARIASGMTQGGLAARAGLHEQQIQQYESNDYSAASLARISSIAQALGVLVTHEVIVPESLEGSFIVNRLKTLGFDQRFIFRRLMPPGIGESVEHLADRSKLASAAAFAAKGLGLKLSDLLGPTVPVLDTRPLLSVRHKLIKSADSQKTSLYTVYAHRLALLVLEGTTGLTSAQAPEDTDVLHDAIESQFGRLDFASALDYCWNVLGIPVIPLNLPGGFHGATWRINGRNIIVLNPGQQFSAFWLHDLLHEIGHTTQEPGQSERSVIELAPTWDVFDNSDDEVDARAYAIDSLFRSRAAELIRKCDRQAGNVEGLKRAVVEVAAQEGVDIGALALLMATSVKSTNWWGTAMTLQDDSIDPFELSKQAFLDHVDFSSFTPEDRDFILLGIQERN